MGSNAAELNCRSYDWTTVEKALSTVFLDQQNGSYETMVRSTSEYGVKRRIVAAATIVNGVIYVGARHFSPIQRAMLDNNKSECYSSHQGFIDQFDVYVCRTLALKIVKANGQAFSPERNSSSKELFSEGVW